MEHLSKRESEKARKGFWIAWALCVMLPISTYTVVVSINTKLWWLSPVTTFVLTFLGYHVFEYWLRNRQRTAQNTIILCACGHEREDHKNDKHCLHVSMYGGHPFLRRDCVCTWYAAKFWTMSNRA